MAEELVARQSGDVIEGHRILSEIGRGAASIIYLAQDQKTKQWTRLATYGGKLVENITQAIARDCLRESMLALDEAGHEQLFTVHDEIIIETTNPTDLATAEAIMSRDLSWAPGLPLRADGFATPYYMKEID